MKKKHNSHGSAGTFHGMEADARALKITGWLTGVYFFIELGLGIYSGSVAVLSDAFHTFSAVGGVLLALVANRISMRPSDKNHTFGMMRAKIVAALLNGVFLLLMALYILWMGYNRLQQSIELPTNIMYLSAAGGLITECIAMTVMWKSFKNNLNMKGAFWHVMQTFIGSIIIIIAAVVIQLTGWMPIDPILGMLFGLVLLWASWGIIKETFDIFLEASPSDINADDIKDVLEKLKEISHVHHIHLWTLTSGKNLLTAHIMIERNEDHEAVLSKVYAVLDKNFNLYFTTLQVEKKCHASKSASFIDYSHEIKENSSQVDNEDKT